MIRRLSIADQAKRDYVVMRVSPDEHSPRVCVSLVSAGDMWGGPGNADNRRRLFASLGVEEACVRSLRQIHSKRVVAVEDVPAVAMRFDDHAKEGDALVAADGKDILAVRVADCFPIFFFDRQSGACAAAHSGWRGTGIVRETLAMMSMHYQTRPEHVSALIGPGIGPCCYDVPHERAASFEGLFGSESVQRRNGQRFLDLRGVNERLLQEEGVTDIVSVADCTSCSPFLGSFRRQGPHHFTHMLALIGRFGYPQP